MTDHREVLYTIDKKGNRNWVYPTWLRGFYVTRRAVVAYFLVAFYLVLPWITINGKQAVLLDIAGRKFTFFGLTLWATDTLILAIVLAALGFSLFFFTSVIGRVWCGWACPETVFLEFVFRPIERLIEGGPVQRSRLDKGPWTKEKIIKKLLKHSFCAFMAWILASTALAYFYGREPLLAMMAGVPWEHWQPFILTVVLMALMAFQFGWFREQFCTVLCPYARFQSVLMDRHSLGVGYDPIRGEPRGKPGKDKEVGDCIDCGLCVRVCPTGIDIRNGNQLECIHCASCIDACDSVMEKLGREPGLIRYDTEHNLLTGEKRKLISPRTAVYGFLLILFGLAFGYVLLTRSPSEAKIVRGPNDAPFVQLPSGQVSNHLHLRLSNRGDADRMFTVSSSQEGFELIIPANPYPVPADSMRTVPLFIQFNKAELKGGRKELIVSIRDDSSYQEDFSITVLGPG
jgi:cytochrome c oxidase accessory protein FixG